MEDRRRILVVDDQESMRSLLKDMLDVIGYDVMLAEGGEEALHLMESNQFDLVLTDLNMPGMGGKQFLDELAANNGIQTKIVIVSGYSKFDSFTLSSQARVSANLVKPFNSKDLLGTIQSVLHPK